MQIQPLLTPPRLLQVLNSRINVPIISGFANLVLLIGPLEASVFSQCSLIHSITTIIDVMICVLNLCPEEDKLTGICFGLESIKGRRWFAKGVGGKEIG
ncbi:hypothetical protein NC652_039753 [Populus alba x Populus x berolinensis]|nr:hypothetical protein NC652_039753 [Populus alba x Populus x berolinensis]